MKVENQYKSDIEPSHGTHPDLQSQTTKAYHSGACCSTVDTWTKMTKEAFLSVDGVGREIR